MDGIAHRRDNLSVQLFLKDRFRVIIKKSNH